MIAAIDGTGPSLDAISILGLMKLQQVQILSPPQSAPPATPVRSTFVPAPAEVAPTVTYNRFGLLADSASPARIRWDQIQYPAIYGPNDINRVYGIDKTGLKGSGQTIAIVDAYDSPEIARDLRIFDKAFGLPDAALTVVNQRGGTPGGAQDAGWAGETALDVEYAHAAAPAAKILLVETDSASNKDIYSAIDYARHQPNVSVVSLSFGQQEFGKELTYDRYLTTPAGHSGITFVAASGDNGAGTLYPAVSPNVLAVGGTTLLLDQSGKYQLELGWPGSGGGISAYERSPAFQRELNIYQFNSNPFVRLFGLNRGGIPISGRAIPDVSLNADPNTGYFVYQGGEWQIIGGTSAAAPIWAGIIALANEKRAHAGLLALDHVENRIYNLPAADFHDVTLGSNGNLAGPGFDLVTGLGTPKVDLIVRDLAKPNRPKLNLPNPFTSSLSTATSNWQERIASILDRLASPPILGGL